MEAVGFFILLLDATLRVSVPLVLAALAGLFSERSGIVDIGLEGKMLGAAFAAAAASYVCSETLAEAGLTGLLPAAAWVGLLAGIAWSMLLALLHGVACIPLPRQPDRLGGGDQHSHVGAYRAARHRLVQPGRTDAATAAGGPLPAGGVAGARRRCRTCRSSALCTASCCRATTCWCTSPSCRCRWRSGWSTGPASACACAPWARTPEAADTAGISVAGMRYRAVLLCAGRCAAVAGAYLSTAQSAAFIKDMTAGKGFIALAALVFGKWRPVPTLLACLLFGFLDAVAARLQGAFDLEASSGLVRELVDAAPFIIEALPYALVVLLLAGFVGRAVAPRASGIPYLKSG